MLEEEFVCRFIIIILCMSFIFFKFFNFTCQSWAFVLFCVVGDNIILMILSDDIENRSFYRRGGQGRTYQLLAEQAEYC